MTPPLALTDRSPVTNATHQTALSSSANTRGGGWHRPRRAGGTDRAARGWHRPRWRGSHDPVLGPDRQVSGHQRPAPTARAQPQYPPPARDAGGPARCASAAGCGSTEPAPGVSQKQRSLSMGFSPGCVRHIINAMERYRFYPDGAIYYVTFTVADWLPVFVSEAACRIVTDSLNFCHGRKGLRTNAYVIMPTHIHAVFFSQDFHPEPLKDTLTDFRKFTGRQLSDYVGSHMPACFSRVLHETAPEDRNRRFWQPSLHPVQIDNESFWVVKVGYLHENPCRKGLVRRQDHWRYSSAAYWMSDGQIANDVILRPSIGKVGGGMASYGDGRDEAGRPRSGSGRGLETRAKAQARRGAVVRALCEGLDPALRVVGSPDPVPSDDPRSGRGTSRGRDEAGKPVGRAPGRGLETRAQRDPRPL